MSLLYPIIIQSSYPILSYPIPTIKRPIGFISKTATLICFSLSPPPTHSELPPSLSPTLLFSFLLDPAAHSPHFSLTVQPPFHHSPTSFPTHYRPHFSPIRLPYSPTHYPVPSSRTIRGEQNRREQIRGDLIRFVQIGGEERFSFSVGFLWNDRRWVSVGEERSVFSHDTAKLGVKYLGFFVSVFTRPPSSTTVSLGMSKLLAWKEKTSSSRKSSSDGMSVSLGKSARSSKFNPEKYKECLQKANKELLELRPKIEVTKFDLESKIAAQLARINEHLARIHLVDYMQYENLIAAADILGHYCRILAERVTIDSLRDRDIPEELKESVACLCYVAGESNQLPLWEVRRQLISRYGEGRIQSVITTHVTQQIKNMFLFPNPSKELCHDRFLDIAHRRRKIWIPDYLTGEKLEEYLKTFA